MSYAIIYVCMFVGLAFCNAKEHPSRFVGGASYVTEEDFLDVQGSGIDFVPILNNQLKQTTANLNQPPLSYFSYICGTKKLVAGLLYHIEYLACANDSKGLCNRGVPPSKCVSKLWFQPWLKRGAPVTVEDAKCKFVTDIESVSECTLKHAPVPSFNEVTYGQQPLLSMDKTISSDDKTKFLFEQFLEKYKKDYGADSTLYNKRFEIFARNLKIVKGLNLLDKSAQYGITEFMDLTEDEFKKYSAPGLTEKKVDIRQVDPDEIAVEAIPDDFDWRSKGAVTEVKNQGQCGSCWAFSTTGNIEGQWFIKKKKLISLSEQELVDCDKLDQGCNGGLPSNAYKAIEKLGGLETESKYPYEAEDDKCQFKKSLARVFINDSVALPTDEAKMAQWLVPHGPISIGINAAMMQFYFGGISHPWRIFCNPNKLDHGVLIVGYGTANGTPYWIIKNSWGPGWGEKGYYRIFRGGGCCGLNKMPTSAIVD